MDDQIGFALIMGIVFVIILAITTMLYHFLVGRTISLEHTIETALKHVGGMLIGGAVAAILYYLGII